MYSYIRGSLEYIGKDYVVVDVNGVGYKIFTAIPTISNTNIKEMVKMYTYLYVREDIMALYGFANPEELEMFELLISVSGVGPKAAISMLCSISPSKFALCLVTNDIKALTSAQGVGNKMAQRIILELKDKIKSEQLADEGEEYVTNDNKISEAVNALIALGYSYNEASKAVKSINQDQDVETIIKMALKSLVRY